MADAPPPAEIEFLEPGQDKPVSAGRVKVRVAVYSKSALTRADLIVDGRRLPLDVSKAQVGDQGQVALIAEMDVRLTRGANNLQVDAINAGGLSRSKPLVISYTCQPLRLVVDSLEPVDGNGARLQAELVNNRWVFKDANVSGLGRLKGRIEFPDGNAADRNDKIEVRAFVNGFQQSAVLEPAADSSKLERSFTADLVFNRTGDNHVCLDAPEQDAGCCSDFHVRCPAPESRQRLHVLIISPKEQDPKQLQDQVLDALQAPLRSLPGRATVFEHVNPITVVGPDTMYDNVWAQLSIIQKMIRKANAIRPMNDVFVVYYAGGEALGERGNVFEAYNAIAQLRWEESGIPCNALVNLLAHTQGAQLLLLDVARKKFPGSNQAVAFRDQIDRWTQEYPDAQLNMGLLRYAWLGQGSRPVDARLITALKQASPRSARLSQLFSLLNETSGPVPKAELAINMYIPTDLENLRLHRGL